MRIIENFNTFINSKKLNENNIIDYLIELDYSEVDPCIVEELNNYCLYYYKLAESYDEEEYIEPKAGDLAKATAKEIGKAAMLSWIIGKVVTKVIDPLAKEVTKGFGVAGNYFGSQVRKAGKSAGKFVDSKTNLNFTKHLKSLDKSYQASKSSVKNLANKVKDNPGKTAGIAIGLILAIAAADKIYRVVKERKKVEDKKRLAIQQENENLKREIAKFNSEIKRLETEEYNIIMHYENIIENEVEIAEKKGEENPKYAQQLVKQVNRDYNQLEKI